MCVFHGGVVFIMSHSFTRSEKAGVWESLRPFRGALPCSLMDFIGPKGKGRNPVYLNAQLCGLLNAALSSFLSDCACIHSKKQKPLTPFVCSICCSVWLQSLHFIDFSIYQFSSKMRSSLFRPAFCFPWLGVWAFLVGLYTYKDVLFGDVRWECLPEWHRHNRFESCLSSPLSLLQLKLSSKTQNRFPAGQSLGMAGCSSFR